MTDKDSRHDFSRSSHSNGRRLRPLLLAITVLVISIFGLIYGLASPGVALAWADCPKGLVNDPYPGRCGRYADTNGDDICDLSQPKPASTTTSPTLTSVTAGEPPTGDCPLGPCPGCGACFGLGAPSSSPTAGGDLAVEATAASVEATSGQGEASFLTHYLVSPLALGFFVVYAASFFLYKRKRISVATHRKVWNVLLLLTFLVTGLFGIILAVQLDYALPFRLPLDLLFWHVEAGIIMTLISFFHLGWHLNYYRNLLRQARRSDRAARNLASRPRNGSSPEWVKSRHADALLAARAVREPRNHRRMGRQPRSLGDEH